MQALFYLKTLAVVAALTSFMFHVKHYEQSQHSLSALKFSITFLENNQQTPPHPNFYKIYVDNILINVENLLRFECGEHAYMFYIFKPPKVGLAQKLLKRESRKIRLTFRVHFFGTQIENTNVFCLLRLVNYCLFFMTEPLSSRLRKNC